MRVLLLADVNSVHTIKWAKNLAKNNITVGIWSIRSATSHDLTSYENIFVSSPNERQERDIISTKLKYLTLIKHAKKFVKEFQPDILHAHYATSYGMIGRLVGFKPFVLSVWGSDVYIFPRKNPLFRWVLKKNLASTDRVLSTSRTMALETSKYTKKEIDITPFGIDVDEFAYQEPNHSTEFSIGCLKYLEPIYGIKYLIEAFALFLKRQSSL